MIRRNQTTLRAINQTMITILNQLDDLLEEHLYYKKTLADFKNHPNPTKNILKYSYILK